MKKLLILVMVLSALLIAVPAGADPITRYVDHKGKCDGNSPCYTTINDAIGDASDGDTVKVYPGVYREFVRIGKPLTLEAARGQPVIQWLNFSASDPERYRGAIRIEASEVTVRGFLLISDGDVLGLACRPLEGGDLFSTTDVLLENNHVKGVRTAYTEPGNHRPGIFACNTSNLIVRNNIVQNTTGMGIFLGLGDSGTDVTDSVIEGNLVVDSEYTGIGLVRGSGNTVRGNDVRSAGRGNHNLDDGIRLGVGATGNTVENNRVFGSNRDGIRAVVAASGNTIQNNVSRGNARYDINDDGPCPSDNTWSDNIYRTEGGSAVCP